MCQPEHQVPPSERRKRAQSPKMTTSRRGFNLTSQTRASHSSYGNLRQQAKDQTHNGLAARRAVERHLAIPVLLVLGLCGAAAAGTPGSADTRCDAGQFQCRDGGCILQAKMCDGRGDCKDGTDEMDCGEQGVILGSKY